MNGWQIECRCRVRGELGETLHAMPRTARSRVVATILASAAEGIDLEALLAAREALRANGILLNQSLRFSHSAGKLDAALMTRIEAVLALIEALVHGVKKDESPSYNS